MIVRSRNYSQSAGGTGGLTPKATRTLLDEIAGKPFEPDRLPPAQLDKREVCRFVADKVRLLAYFARLSGSRNLTWMLESAYYEAYEQAICNNSGSVILSKPPSSAEQ